MQYKLLLASIYECLWEYVLIVKVQLWYLSEY